MTFTDIGMYIDTDYDHWLNMDGWTLEEAAHIFTNTNFNIKSVVEKHYLGKLDVTKQELVQAKKAQLNFFRVLNQLRGMDFNSICWTGFDGEIRVYKKPLLKCAIKYKITYDPVFVNYAIGNKMTLTEQLMRNSNDMPTEMTLTEQQLSELSNLLGYLHNDLNMLLDGSWEPDADSINCSIDSVKSVAELLNISLSEYSNEDDEEE